MKKTLLVLALLVVTGLPGMAKDCVKYYNLEQEWRIEQYIATLVYRNDLECIKYFIDEKGIDIQKASEQEPGHGFSLINVVFENDSGSGPEDEMISFLLEHGIKPTKEDMHDIYSHVGFVFYQHYCLDEDLNDQRIKNFKFLLTKGGADVWNAFDDEKTLKYIIDRAQTDYEIGNASPLFSFFLDLVPLDRYDMFLKAALKYNEERNCERVIKLIESYKKSKMDEISRNIGETLNKYNEQRLQQYEQEYKVIL